MTRRRRRVGVVSCLSLLDRKWMMVWLGLAWMGVKCIRNALSLWRSFTPSKCLRRLRMSVNQIILRIWAYSSVFRPSFNRPFMVANQFQGWSLSSFIQEPVPDNHLRLPIPQTLCLRPPSTSCLIWCEGKYLDLRFLFGSMNLQYIVISYCTGNVLSLGSNET